MKVILRYVPGFRSEIRWKKVIASIYYLLIAFLSAAMDFGGFLFFIGCPFFVCAIMDLISNAIKKTPNGQPVVTLVVAIALTVTGLSLASEPAPAKQTSAEKALDYLIQAETYIAQGNTEAALEAIASSKKLNPDKAQNDGFLLEEQIMLLKSDDYLKEKLIDLSDNDFELLKSGKFSIAFIEHEKLNAMFTSKLIANADKRAGYIAQAEEQQILAEEEAERKRLEERKKSIEQEFSAWDGSHINLTKAIKRAMNDPKSYQHVETGYWDMGDHLIVVTTFRGKNAFGGLVKNTIKAKVSLDGDVLEIMEQW